MAKLIVSELSLEVAKEKRASLASGVNNPNVPEQFKAGMKDTIAQLDAHIEKLQSATKTKIVKPRAEKKPKVTAKEPKKKTKVVRPKEEQPVVGNRYNKYGLELIKTSIGSVHRDKFVTNMGLIINHAFHEANFHKEADKVMDIFGIDENWEETATITNKKAEEIGNTLAQKGDYDSSKMIPMFSFVLKMNGQMGLADKLEKIGDDEPAKKPELKGYAARIVDITGCTPEDAEGVEEIMREDIFHSTLDWVDPKAFEEAANEAYEQLQYMRSPEGIAYMEKVAGNKEQIDKILHGDKDEKSKVYTDKDGVKYWAERTMDGKAWCVIAQAGKAPATEAFDDWLAHKEDAEAIARKMSKGIDPDEEEPKEKANGHNFNAYAGQKSKEKYAGDSDSYFYAQKFGEVWNIMKEKDGVVKMVEECELKDKSEADLLAFNLSDIDINDAVIKSKEKPAAGDDDVTACKKVLEAAHYTVKKKTVKTKNGKKTVTTREPRPDRTIIKDRTDSVFTTITKSFSSEKEKAENKELLEVVDGVRELVVKIMTSLDKLVSSKEVEEIKKIKKLLAKLV